MQDARELRNEIRKIEDSPQIKQQNNSKTPKKETQKGREGNCAKKSQREKKENEKQINYNDTSSEEFDKLEESEEEKGNEREPRFNMENEFKQILKASWKNEIDTHLNSTISRIISRHFKKIRSGLNLVM
jgi:hypothetical protein